MGDHSKGRTKDLNKFNNKKKQLNFMPYKSLCSSNTKQDQSCLSRITRTNISHKLKSNYLNRNFCTSTH